MSFYLLKTLPNTDASGFLVSINNVGGTSCHCSATLIEEDGTAYYIMFGNCGGSKLNYSFVNHNVTFYFKSEDELNITLDEINYVINKTEFYEEKFFFHVNYYIIEYYLKMNLSAEEIINLKEIIHNSGFIWFDEKIGYGFSGMTAGGSTIIITIPEYHKSVESVAGNAPDGFRRIYSYIYNNLLDVYGENNPFQ